MLDGGTACFRSLSAAASPCRAARFCSPSCTAASHPCLLCTAVSGGGGKLASAAEPYQEPPLFLLSA